MAIADTSLLASQRFTLLFTKWRNDYSADSITTVNMSTDINNFSTEEKLSSTNFELVAVRLANSVENGSRQTIESM